MVKEKTVALERVKKVTTKALTEMYSMPNGEQEQDPEGEASGGESGEWHSDGEEDEERDDPSDEEETGQSSKCPQTSSPAPTEKAPKQSKAAPSKPQKALPKINVAIPTVSGAATSETSAYKNEDKEMEDAVTSNPAPPHVIDLPDDDVDVPLRPQGRRNRKASAGKTPQSASATETAIQEGGNANRTSKSCELGARFAELEKKQI
nr:uncharacterized protein LOC109742317 [Aegilops tauschii subsp. strangulata]